MNLKKTNQSADIGREQHRNLNERYRIKITASADVQKPHFLKIFRMKKYITVIAFKIGVDVLGFPEFHKTFKDNFFIIDSQFFKAYSK